MTPSSDISVPLIPQLVLVSYVRVRVLCTSTSAVQVRVQYGCNTQIIEQNLPSATVLYALAHTKYAATTATTFLLLYDGASIKRKASQTQSRAGMIISSTEKCQRVSLPGFGVVFASPPEIWWCF